MALSHHNLTDFTECARTACMRCLWCKCFRRVTYWRTHSLSSSVVWRGGGGCGRPRELISHVPHRRYSVRVERRQVGPNYCRGGWGGERGKDDRKHNKLAPLLADMKRRQVDIQTNAILAKIQRRGIGRKHRLNVELDLQSLSGLWLRPRTPPPPIPRILAHIRGRDWPAKIDDISLSCDPLAGRQWPVLKTGSERGRRQATFSHTDSVCLNKRLDSGL